MNIFLLVSRFSPRSKAGHVNAPDFEVNGYTMEGSQSGPQVRFSFPHICLSPVIAFVELFIPPLCREEDAVPRSKRDTKSPHASLALKTLQTHKLSPLKPD